MGVSMGGVVSLVVGAALVIGSALTGMCRVQPTIAYGSAAVLLLAALGTGLGWSWTRLIGRIAAWLNVLLFAMLVVPDWDDAAITGKQALHFSCAAIALYFVLCAVVLGLKPKTGNDANGSSSALNTIRK
jgi:hypothetical protein